MDPLGKKGEQAFEGVQNISERLEELESHLHAVDSALQDFMDDSQHVLDQEFRLQKEEINQLEEARKENFEEEQDIRDIEDRLDELERKQHMTEKKLEELQDSDIMDAISRATGTIKKLSTISRGLRKDIDELEDRLEGVESELTLEVNRRDYDFEQKLDKSEFEAEKVEMMEMIKSLRASVNVLADELDSKDEIEVD